MNEAIRKTNQVKRALMDISSTASNMVVGRSGTGAVHIKPLPPPRIGFKRGGEISHAIF